MKIMLLFKFDVKYSVVSGSWAGVEFSIPFIYE